MIYLLIDLRSDIFDRNAIPARPHFAQGKHRFNKHAKYTLTKSITSTNKPKKSLQQFLKRRENFFIRTLQTLQPHGLNHEWLN